MNLKLSPDNARTRVLTNNNSFIYNCVALGSEENNLEFDDFHKLVTSKEDMCEDGLTIRDVFNVS